MLRLNDFELRVMFFVMFFILISLVADAQEAGKTEPQTDLPKPATAEDRIDLVFVLDSTGSMGGLIEGAKAKIWSTANSMITLPSKPKIRIGLLTYRDKGDEYVTKIFDLTDDIDKVFADLTSFVAAGGGDLPESVNQALDEAVNEMSWDKTNPRVYKVIFLVGDCPPHMDYHDDIKYPVTCKKAAENGIIINTIQCGMTGGCETIWRDIARKSDGEYACISQTGDVQVVATPFDAEIGKLSIELNKTVLGYGSPKQQVIVSKKLSLAESSHFALNADRAAYNVLEKGKAIQGVGDLVADIDSKKIKLDSIAKDELPEKLKGKSKEEQQKYLSDLSQKREEINKKILEQTKKRAAWLEEEKKKNNNENQNSFDVQLQKIIEKQATKIFNKTN
jgi:Mg-chelatase subunit ChlD